jgi:hypothetical protein
MKKYRVTINASPRYPIKEVVVVSASGWSTAIARAVKEYFHRHKNMHSEMVSVFAQKIKINEIEENCNATT